MGLKDEGDQDVNEEAVTYFQSLLGNSSARLHSREMLQTVTLNRINDQQATEW